MRYSRQKEEIFNIVTSGRLRHPSADEVYLAMREIRPSISMGTVYRNLAVLVQNGILSKIQGVDGSDRFDSQTDTHGHFICESCGEIFDFKIDDVKDSIKASLPDFKICSGNVLMRGICQHCAKPQARGKLSKPSNEAKPQKNRKE